MPFYRFDAFEKKSLTPHLSSAEGPIIEGEYMYFCKVTKAAGTGSELHYHPNELMIFALTGGMNVLVGKDRRIVRPGTFVHIPPYARHQVKATEDGVMDYLYVKDKTWTVVGIAEDEAPPDRPPTVEEVNEIHRAGRWAGQEKAPEKSRAVVEGLKCSYYPILDSLEAPERSGLHSVWVEGERLAFGFVELPAGYPEPVQANEHEQFVYVIRGTLDAQVDDERKEAGPGSIVHIPKGSRRSLSARKGRNVRYASVRASQRLEDLLRK